ncbi:ABC transporter permease [Oceanobacillus chungangensis]|uniref:ABC transporter permease n=1 Tax=Oceanobacillus chungangensis TaxID=1229152 RepID=A0A3D8PNL7_9BACI|nr:ABC transporter permease [Oceanobacillus chungangensis]RDW17700.1 ABC transporter permease [Oceanobacillus chungangensis]
MTLSINKYVIYNLKELLKNGYLVVGLLGACVPAIIMTYYILNESTPFNIKHISSFYCMLGMLAAVLLPLFFINRDYSTKTISLINNSVQNRRNYVFANGIIALSVSLLYTMTGIVLLLVTKALGVSGDLKLSFLAGFSVNVFLLVMTYFLFGYLLFLYGVRSGAVYGILTAILLFFPNALFKIQGIIHNEFLFELIENFPGYFYPAKVGSNPLSPLQYSIGCLTLIVLFVVVLKKSEKIEV